MKKFLLIILGVTLLAPVFAGTWTVLVYMAADNNLWQNAVLDINQMESATQPANLKLVVQSDMPADSPYPGGQRRLIQPDNSTLVTSPLVEDLGAIDSGNPQTLNDFINWGFTQYPSQHRMLVIWGHGDNWFKAPESKWICPDNSAQSLMSVADGDLRRALAGIPKLDILLFDACSMQSLEVLAEVMDVADYVVGSAELVPAAGFPYQEIVPLFFPNGAEEIASLTAQKYLESYEPGGSQNPDGFVLPLTCSAIRTAALPEFFERFEVVFGTGTSMAQPIVEYIREGLWEMGTAYCDVDIGEFIASCSVIPPSPELLYWPYWLFSKWDPCVVFAGNLNIPLVAEPVGSAAIWFPWHRQYFDAWWRQYSKLRFAKTRWLSFLNAGLGDAVPPDAPQLSNPVLFLGDLTFRVRQPLDPEALIYEVTVTENVGGSPQTYLFEPGYDEAEFYVAVPVGGAGSVAVVAIDSSENRSLPAVRDFEFEEPALELAIAPNPVHDRNLASACWYLLEGYGSNLELTLHNARGQKVLSKSVEQNSPGAGIWLLSAEPSFPALGKGVYLLRLSVGTRHVVKKLTLW